MNWYISVLRDHYADFNGRAHREEFWMFILINFLVSLVIGFIPVVRLLSFVYALAVFVPSLAVGARRLHDTDRSGWWQLLALVPFIGVIALIILDALDGTPGENRYGPDPKGRAATTP